MEVGRKETAYRRKEGKPLYTEQDYADIRGQIRRRAAVLAIPAVLLLGGIIAAAICRIRWLTTGLTILLGAGCIFAYGLLLSPLMAYERHLDEVLHGRVRTVTGVFKAMESTVVVRDGVRYYPMTLNVGNMDEETDDRLFYYDANLPLPDWTVGETLTVTAHDKALGDWVRA